MPPVRRDESRSKAWSIARRISSATETLDRADSAVRASYCVSSRWRLNRLLIGRDVPTHVYLCACDASVSDLELFATQSSNGCGWSREVARATAPASPASAATPPAIQSVPRPPSVVTRTPPPASATSSAVLRRPLYAANARPWLAGLDALVDQRPEARVLHAVAHAPPTTQQTTMNTKTGQNGAMNFASPWTQAARSVTHRERVRRDPLRQCVRGDRSSRRPRP